MVTQEVKRKLTAILSADVKGYSRLMGEDEERTARTLSTYKEVMAGLIQHHYGRVVDAPGDNVLAEFASVVDAVRCAVEIQKEVKTRNADLPENRRMEFRIGLNLGDVIEEGEKILGDGVNIAARMESLSEAGGICISGTAFDQVKNKLNLGYKYLGEQTVKNILEPVRVYRVLMEPEAAGKVIGEKKVKPRQWKRVALSLGVILIVIIAAVVAYFNLRPSASRIEVASKEKMAFPLPDDPSIAVMPFVNMSGDPKQEFLSDGITENVITALSKVPRLLVISRQSTFFYKAKPVKVKQVSEELGVQYVLEGSVQRSADRIRINAQLIDALTGHHIWAERYDRDLKDLFAIQDEITLRILTAVQVKLTLGGQVSGPTKYYGGKQSIDCYLKLTEAAGYFNRWNIQDNNLARRLIEEVIAMCPDIPSAYSQLATVHQRDYWLGSTKSPRETLEKGIELAKKAIAMDDSLFVAHAILCNLYSIKKEYDKAIAEGERALALNPGSTVALVNYALVLIYTGRPEEAIPLHQKALRLNPFAPSYLYLDYGHALRNAERFEEAVSALKKAIQIAPDNFPAHLHLAATFSMMGREKEARAEAAEVLRINPKFSLDSYAKRLTYKDQSQVDKLIDALRKAGLPEKPLASIPPSAEVAPKEKIMATKSEKVSKAVTLQPPKEEIASREKMAFPLPDKPSIAVLAFTNMGSGKELEYFSDGLAEGIINGLSKSEHIFVIARNSSFTYKGKPVKVKQVAEEMGVRYVMEGSVQQEKNRVRITAQLIDALTGRHLFSERYDRDLKDILNLQDEITLKVLIAVHVKLVTGESVRGLEKGTKNLDAYLKVLQAREHKGGTFNKERVKRAMQLLEEAIALDPEYAYAYSVLSTAHFDLVVLGASESPRESLQRAVELGEKAIALDDFNSSIHAGLTFPYIYIREYDKAISEAEKAISLSPNSAAAYWALGTALSLSGRPQEAIPMFQKSLRLSPIPVHSQVLGLLASSYNMLGQYEEAIATYKKVLQIYGPDHLMAHIGLALAYASMGRENEARAEGAEVLRIDPKFSIERYVMGIPDQSKRERMAAALRKAGLK
jgi:adenylate cyclase